MAEFRILRRKQVEDRVGLGRSAIYAMVKVGKFPAPIVLSRNANGDAGSVGWVEGEISDWIAARIADSRKAA